VQRATGTLLPGASLGAHDHLCRAYAAAEDPLAPTIDFLAEGIALGQRILYVGDGSREELTGHLAPLAGIEELLDRGAAEVVSLGGRYLAGSGSVVDVDAQVAGYTAATAVAVAAGFGGLRAAADVTTLVATPEQRDAFARYEHRIDRAMRAMPFSAMCLYGRGVLGDEAVAELACMHPLLADEVSPFRVFAGDRHDLAVGGEVDTLSAPAFARAVARAVPDVASGRLVIDASELRFIDHHGLDAIDRLGCAHGAAVVLRDAPAMTARLAALLDLVAVEVEVRS
jgi:anti-anti-sigma regulatory factor